MQALSSHPQLQPQDKGAAKSENVLSMIGLFLRCVAANTQPACMLACMIFVLFIIFYIMNGKISAADPE